MELPPTITSLSDTTYLVKLADGSELALDLLLFPQYKDLVVMLATIETRISKGEAGRETIEILLDRDLYFLKSQRIDVHAAIDAFRARCLAILDMLGEAKLQSASPLFAGAVTHFLNGNLFETVITLDDPQIEVEAKQSEEHRMRTVLYYHLKALTCLLLGDPKKAGVYFEKMILINPSADTYHRYAQMLAETKQEMKAVAMEQEALKLALTDMQQAMLWERIGALSAVLRNASQAAHAYEQALMRYNAAPPENAAGTMEKEAAVLIQLGDLVRTQGRRNDSATAYTHALSVYTDLSRTTPGGYVRAIASVQHRLGVLANSTNTYAQAEFHSQTARKLQQPLTNPSDRAAYAQTLRSLGSLYAKTRQSAKAAAILVQSFETYTRLAHTDPKQYLPPLLDVLKLLDSQYIALNQPQAAQTVRTYASRIGRFLTIILVASLVRRKTSTGFAQSVSSPTPSPTKPFLSRLINLFRRS